jgi:hypothetical protein
MLTKLGAARARAPTARRLVEIEMDKESSQGNRVNILAGDEACEEVIVPSRSSSQCE